MKMAMAGTPYSIPSEPGRWRAITLAVVMHTILFAFLWLGIRWQSQTPVAVEAEVWNLNTKEAAPRVAPPPEPVVKPEPKPELKIEKELPVQKPDIALEREKKRKEKEARLEDERLLKEKQKADALAKKKEETKIKREQELADAKLAEKLRADEMKRLMGGTGGTGDAPKSQGMRGDPDYYAKIGAKIKSNTIFVVPPDLQGNPAVEYEVKLFPDGSLRGTPRKIKSSGIPAFDAAVLLAIEKSAPYPPDKSGSVPSSFPVIHQPKER